MDQKDQRYILQTKAWIKEFVIKLQLCPFAHRVFEEDRIRYFVSESSEVKEVLQLFWQELEYLMEEKTELSTSILILPQWKSFEQYLSCYYAAETLLEQTETTNIFQLASFHPNYVFDGVNSRDVSNFTNRSPFPLIHILRTEEVTNAIENFSDVEQIPSRNISLMKKMGRDALEEIFKSF